jgi:hypothetical protein
MIIDTVIDLAILLLPIRYVFTLQLPRKIKLAIAGIFALGGGLSWLPVSYGWCICTLVTPGLS